MALAAAAPGTQINAVLADAFTPQAEPGKRLAEQRWEETFA
jgi:hypothetical protein